MHLVSLRKGVGFWYVHKHDINSSQISTPDISSWLSSQLLLLSNILHVYLLANFMSISSVEYKTKKGLFSY